MKIATIFLLFIISSSLAHEFNKKSVQQRSEEYQQKLQEQQNKIHQQHHHNVEQLFNWEKPLITLENLTSLKQKATYKVIEYDNHPFKNMSATEIKNKLGLIDLKNMSGKPIVYHNHGFGAEFNNYDADIPASFDSRQQWPECIHEIRDQQHCGACWAFAASGALSDRFCIATNGNVNVLLSPQDLLSCDHQERGCQGGMINTAWDYLRDNGVVTESCYPYIAQEDQCPFEYQQQCQDGSQYQKYYVSDHGQLLTVDQAKQDLVNNGPIEAGFMVYEDFLNYNGGIYRRASDHAMGGHAVRVVGYGQDVDGTEYWIVANTWTTSWGENGYFNIAFGECDFENQLWSGIPRTEGQNVYEEFLQFTH